MHYGVEEMFFVLAGTPTVRTPEGEEQLSPGDVVYFPEGPEGLHTFSNTTEEPARLLAVSSKRFPDVVAYPEQGYAWVATRHPERPVPEDGDSGIIARFDLRVSDANVGLIPSTAQARVRAGLISNRGEADPRLRRHGFGEDVVRRTNFGAYGHSVALS